MFQGASTSYGVEPNNIPCALLVKLKLRPLGEPPSKWLGEHDRSLRLGWPNNNDINSLGFHQRHVNHDLYASANHPI